MKRKKGFISSETLKKIAKEVEKYEAGIRLSRWGEPLLHPRFSECLSIIKSAGIILLISTNATLLNKEKRKTILEHGVNTVRISFQGLNEKEYSFMRNTDKYDVVVNNLKSLVKEREENNPRRPFVILNTTITKETPEEVKNFKKKWGKIVDKVEVGKTTFSQIEDVERVKELRLVREESFTRKYKPCTEVLTKLSVDWDGDITACCSDYDKFMTLGNINYVSLKETWESPKIKTFRDMLGEKLKHAQLPLCKNCYSAESKFDKLKKNKS